MKRLAFSFLLLALCSLSFASEWQTDSVQAREEAKKAGKPIVVVLTAAELGGPTSVKLDGILKEEGVAKLLEGYHKAMIQMRSRADLSEDKIKEITDLVEDFSLIKLADALPILIFLDSKGRTMALYQYNGEDSAIVQQTLQKIETATRTRDAILATAEATEDPVEKAALIDSALSIVMRMAPLVGYDKEIEELLKADKAKNGSLGYKKKYWLPMEMNEISSLLNANKPDEAYKRCDKVQKEFSDDPVVVQAAMYYKSVALLFAGKRAEAIQMMKDALNAAPDSPNVPGISMHLQRLQEEDALGQGPFGDRQE